MYQRGISCRCSPGLGLSRLRFWRRADGKQIGLADFQGVGDDFQAMIQHPAKVCMVVVL